MPDTRLTSMKARLEAISVKASTSIPEGEIYRMYAEWMEAEGTPIDMRNYGIKNPAKRMIKEMYLKMHAMGGDTDAAKEQDKTPMP